MWGLCSAITAPSVSLRPPSSKSSLAQLCMNEMAQTPLVSLPAVSLPPNLIHLLQSNDPPQESQIPLIRDIISDDQNRIILMDAEIFALETQIHNLNANLAQSLQKRNDAAVHAHQHRSILSPIRRVPPELICEIFEILHDGKAGTRPPWSFGHICRSWRHIALSFEQLWSFIVVRSPPSAKWDALVASIEVQLQRSAHVPLDIYFPDVRSEMDSRVLGLVLSRCNRWRSLCLDRGTRLPDCNVVLDWLRPVEGHLDQLVKLEARHYWIAIPDIFSTAPRLREVVLTNNRLDESSSSIVIPWQQITHYRGTFSSECQLQTPTVAPRLVECTLGFRGALNLVPPDNRHFTQTSSPFFGHAYCGAKYHGTGA
ncbi:F-box domain-containing protein [Mycena venus]|uniref:F-box domain-containing protein n=1 Tax=Mycena venus TaxID=2733690 RepID=A0A8H7DHL7_9AGAR|nr:F-box domain-containing protein [Mycena venus]